MFKDLLPWKKDQGANVPLKRTEEPFIELRSRMNDLFNRFFDDFHEDFWCPTQLAEGQGARSPRFEVTESDDHYHVSVELPGMDEKDIDLSIDGRMLTLKGEKKSENEEKKKNYYFTERHYGNFQRSLALPDGLDLDQVKAKFKKGVLDVDIQKTEDAKSHRRKVTVTS